MEVMENSADPVSTEENGFSEAAVDQSGDGDIKHSLLNGLTNGYDKEKKEKDKHHDKNREKEKHRDGDRDKHRKEGDRDKHKEKYKDRDREKEKHREKDKERDKDRDRQKDKERDKGKERDKEKEKDRHHDKSKHSSSSSSSKDKHSSSSSSKDKERKDKEHRSHDDKDRKDKEHKSSSSSSKDKEHKSSSSSKHSSSSSSKPSSGSSKDKEHKDKERDKEKDKNRDKEKDKERSKEKHSSSKDKERHSSEKHKSEKDKQSSSSSKDKDRHSSEKKDKHREKDRDKEKSKDKEKEKDKDKPKEKPVENDVKIIVQSPEVKQEEHSIKEEKDNDFALQSSFKEESMDIDDDEGKLMIKEEPTDDESKFEATESSIDTSFMKTEVKEEEEDELPMAARMKRMLPSDDEDDVPLIARKKPKKESVKKRKKVDSDYEEEEEEEFKPAKKKKQVKQNKQVKKEKKSSIVKREETESPKKRKKKEEEQQEVWKWWEEEKKPDGVKWNFLEHKGPVFAPPYEPLPKNVKFYYKDEEIKLSEPAEEVATFYARMLDHDYTTKEAFNTNYMKDWRSVMTKEEQARITNLSKCNFKHMHAFFVKQSEERKARSKEEKKAIKDENEALVKEYGFCLIDGHKEKIGNFKIEPPGLFRGRGEHPKMGKLKRRVVAEDIIINCSKDSKIPKPPEGHRWKEVKHDNSVTWLASWTENVQGQVKYIMLNPSSKLKGEKDWQKYETARKLAKSIVKIREDYIADWKSKEMRIRQRAVAMYFIDKLALRAGNEKDEDQADTVGCCSLRVEHISLHEDKDGKENVVVFDFLGKDSIRYYNEVSVEKRVFKNLKLFMENKKEEDDLFDRLNTTVLNKHLSDLMEGLTAKVFRTYNASWTLQNQLKELTDPDSSPAEMLLSYNRANRAVAILCNHQRAVPKTHDKSMANLREKLNAKRQAVEDAESNYKHAKRDAKNGSQKEKILADKAKKTVERLKEQLLRLELQETDREENKTIALGTSKLNYLDPRISVAWCKKFDVPIEKVYNKTQRDKFRWAIDMATADYVF